MKNENAHLIEKVKGNGAGAGSQPVLNATAGGISQWSTRLGPPKELLVLQHLHQQQWSGTLIVSTTQWLGQVNFLTGDLLHPDIVPGQRAAALHRPLPLPRDVVLLQRWEWKLRRRPEQETHPS
ncbi:MAG: hypothetical protein GY696_13300 [Gammaproteobacteria bacterium]|nr:hypothetical protein [Gammaproteobacteria bacterium]